VVRRSGRAREHAWRLNRRLNHKRGAVISHPPSPRVDVVPAGDPDDPEALVEMLHERVPHGVEGVVCKLHGLIHEHPVLVFCGLPVREKDKDLLGETILADRKFLGQAPSTLNADEGFYESPEQLAKLEEEIETVSICKKGKRTKAEEEREHGEAFRAGQRFRAGVEGAVSVLKRAFKLARCLFKGFKNYASSVGDAVFCHNLALLGQR
jgi:hypothetical protein